MGVPHPYHIASHAIDAHRSAAGTGAGFGSFAPLGHGRRNKRRRDRVDQRRLRTGVCALRRARFARALRANQKLATAAFLARRRLQRDGLRGLSSFTADFTLALFLPALGLDIAGSRLQHGEQRMLPGSDTSGRVVRPTTGWASAFLHAAHLGSVDVNHLPHALCQRPDWRTKRRHDWSARAGLRTTSCSTSPAAAGVTIFAGAGILALRMRAWSNEDDCQMM